MQREALRRLRYRVTLSSCLFDKETETTTAPLHTDDDSLSHLHCKLFFLLLRLLLLLLRFSPLRHFVMAIIWTQAKTLPLSRHDCFLSPSSPRVHITYARGEDESIDRRRLLVCELQVQSASKWSAIRCLEETPMMQVPVRDESHQLRGITTRETMEQILFLLSPGDCASPLTVPLDIASASYHVPSALE